jgi:hypothetical protein
MIQMSDCRCDCPVRHPGESSKHFPVIINVTRCNVKRIMSESLWISKIKVMGLLALVIPFLVIRLKRSGVVSQKMIVRKRSGGQETQPGWLCLQSFGSISAKSCSFPSSLLARL